LGAPDSTWDVFPGVYIEERAVLECCGFVVLAEDLTANDAFALKATGRG
jgi:hypothetical protein